MDNSDVLKVKKKITRKRVEIQDEKSTVEKLGDVTKAVSPEQVSVMYAGKMCAMLLKQHVASSNILAGYKRAYEGQLAPGIEKELTELHEGFEEGFAKAKRQAVKIVEKSPLWAKLSGVKGFSAYQLALIMAYVKDIARFETPSRLAVYAGVAPVKDMALTKGNLNRIREHYLQEGKEFKGFNTHLSQRMYIIAESLMRGQGYFYNLYARLRERLEQRAINNNECHKEGDKWVMNAPYKNYSLIMWSHNNARRRICRVLLHFIWAEWRKMAGLEVRMPYAIDYLKHSGYISLEEVLKADSVKLKRGRRKTDEKTG